MANSFSIRENSIAKYTAQLVDEDGVGISSADLNTFTLTLYNLSDGAIINSRNSQDVLNNNNVTVGSTGLVTWSIQQTDSVITDTVNQPEYETHIALWEWVWASNTKGSNLETELVIQNLTMIP
jgi:hypothetical protein